MRLIFEIRELHLGYKLFPLIFSNVFFPFFITFTFVKDIVPFLNIFIQSLRRTVRRMESNFLSCLRQRYRLPRKQRGGILDRLLSIKVQVRTISSNAFIQCHFMYLLKSFVTRWHFVSPLTSVIRRKIIKLVLNRPFLEICAPILSQERYVSSSKFCNI